MRTDGRRARASAIIALALLAIGCELAPPIGTVIRCASEDPQPGAVSCEAAIAAIRPHIPPGPPVESIVFNVGMRCQPLEAGCPYTPFVATIDVRRVDGTTLEFSVTSHDGVLDIRRD